jgi:hypothetical protein
MNTQETKETPKEKTKEPEEEKGDEKGKEEKREINFKFSGYPSTLVRKHEPYENVLKLEEILKYK